MRSAWKPASSLQQGSGAARVLGVCGQVCCGRVQGGRQAVPGGRFAVGESRVGSRSGERSGGLVLASGPTSPIHVFPGVFEASTEHKKHYRTLRGDLENGLGMACTVSPGLARTPGRSVRKVHRRRTQDGSVSRSAAAHRPRAARDLRGPRRASEPMR
jgi:hypothetical protein